MKTVPPPSTQPDAKTPPIDEIEEDTYTPFTVEPRRTNVTWTVQKPTEGWPKAEYDRFDDIFFNGMDISAFITQNANHRFRLFASMLGGQITETKIAMIRIVASLLTHTRNFVINTVQSEDNKLSPWIMISFVSIAHRHLLVEQQAVVCTQLKQAILFRGIPSEPANKRYAMMRQVPTKHYDAIVPKLQTLYHADSALVTMAGGSATNGQHDAVISFTLSDANKKSFMVRSFDEVRVEDKTFFRINSPITCSACHSNSHRIYYCGWKNVLPKIAFDIEIGAESNVALEDEYEEY